MATQPVLIPPTDLKRLAEQLKVIAEPSRLEILHLLMEGVHCNCELGEALKMPSNLISHHLRVLRKAGLVDVERDAFDARWVYYSLNTEAMSELNTTFRGFFDPARVKPRSPTCGPHGAVVPLKAISGRSLERARLKKDTP